MIVVTHDEKIMDKLDVIHRLRDGALVHDEPAP